MDTLLQFALVSLLIELTPGPNMIYLALLAAQHGRRAGFAAAAGVALGLSIIGFAAAAGLASFLDAFPLAIASLRWAGFLYLLYLAWDAWREANRPATDAGIASHGFFGRGLVTNLLNPKAMVFYIAVLPTFTSHHGDALAQSLWLTGVYVTVATAIHALIVTISGSIQPLLVDGMVRRLSGAVFAASLLAVAIWFVWSTGHNAT